MTKANAETLRALLWALDREGIEPEAREAMALAARAPAEWLDRLRHLDAGVAPPDMVAARDALAAAGRLRRAARKLDRLNLEACNGVERFDSRAGRTVATWTDSDAERADAERERNRERVHAAARDLLGAAAESVEIETGGDPRGAAVKLWHAADRLRSRGWPFFTL